VKEYAGAIYLPVTVNSGNRKKTAARQNWVIKLLPETVIRSCGPGLLLTAYGHSHVLRILGHRLTSLKQQK
jgi:hypothetical protein